MYILTQHIENGTERFTNNFYYNNLENARKKFEEIKRDLLLEYENRNFMVEQQANKIDFITNFYIYDYDNEFKCNDELVLRELKTED